MQKGAYYQLVLASSLTADVNEEFDIFRHGSANQGAPGTAPDAGTNLIDQYQYVMHGKIFEDELSDNNEIL